MKKPNRFVSAVLAIFAACLVGITWLGWESPADQAQAASFSRTAVNASVREALPQKSAPVLADEEPEESEGDWVWIPTNGGRKYHSKRTCSGMEDPQLVEREEAQRLGFDACAKCY